MYHYREFVERVWESQKKGMEASQAINEAVDYAIQHKFLEGFFEEQKMYITNSLLTEFDQELHDRCTYEDGVAEGAHNKALETARNFLSMNLSVEQVARGTGLSLEEVLSLKNETVQA